MKRFLTIFFFSVILFAWIFPSQATIIIRGNTFLDGRSISEDYISFDGTINWVVATQDEVSDMISSFQAGDGCSDFDTSAELVFMYQIANNGGGLNEDNIVKFVQTVGTTTSWGYFSNWGFSDNGNAIGIDENMGLDTWPDSGTNMRHGGIAGFVSNLGTYVDPNSAILDSDLLTWSFDPDLSAQTGVSPILVSTVDISAWAVMTGSISRTEGGDLELSGESPHAPEPTTILLLGLGGILLRKRNR